jgi:transposase
MPSRYPVGVRRQVVELARTGMKVSRLSGTFGMTQASIYSWLKQDRIDRGEAPGLSTEGQMELAAAKRRIRQLETELAVLRRRSWRCPGRSTRCSSQSLYPVIASLTGQGFCVS